MYEFAKIYEKLRWKTKNYQKKKWVYNFGLRHELKTFAFFYWRKKAASNLLYESFLSFEWLVPLKETTDFATSYKKVEVSSKERRYSLAKLIDIPTHSKKILPCVFHHNFPAKIKRKNIYFIRMP